MGTLFRLHAKRDIPAGSVVRATVLPIKRLRKEYRQVVDRRLEPVLIKP